MDGIKKRQRVVITVASDPDSEPEVHTPIEETIEALASLRKKSSTRSQTKSSMKDGNVDLLFEHFFKPVHEVTKINKML